MGLVGGGDKGYSRGEGPLLVAWCTPWPSLVYPRGWVRQIGEKGVFEELKSI